jgi:choice-of-anchor B domain-containing protein
MPALALALLVGTATSIHAQTAAGGSTEPAVAGFGGALEIVDGAVLVGEPMNSIRTGLVYVYAKSGGTWTERTQSRADDGAPADGFGSALARDGEQLLIGAFRSAERGAAYLFRRQGDGWAQVAKLEPQDTAAGQQFGRSAALLGDVAVMGAPDAGERLGAAYIFVRGAGGEWTQVRRLAPVGQEGRVQYGAAVALVGNMLFVGAPGLTENTGAVYAYRRGADGSFAPAGRLSATGAERNAQFGAALHVSDDGRLLVGAPFALGGIGTVHHYAADEQTGEWRENGRYFAFDGARPDGFGAAITSDGGELWIGAPRAAGMRGAIYQVHADAATPAVTKLTRAATEPRAGFGGRMALEADVAAVAMTSDDYGAGTVVIFERSGDVWQETAVLKSADERIASVMGAETKCTNGVAAAFDCQDVDLLAFMNVTDLGGGRGVEVNDIWGWTDPETGREYALVGRVDGTSFVDISNPSNPVLVGNLPKTEGSPGAIWRDIKVYKDHAYIVADASGAHGVQVFDLTRLRGRTAPETFTPDTTYHGINSAHNIVINEETGFAYSVGSSSGGETCGGGLHMIDIREPKSPTFAGCFADPQTGRASTGYSHDAVCVVYHGPDEAYQGHEICFGANETALSIADVTDKDAPQALARASYPNVGYSHQSWPSEDHRYLYMDDELDELAGSVSRTRTLVWDITDLDDPQLVKEFMGTTGASDHNLYIRDNLMYQSHYLAGLRIVDISDPANPVEVGYFDTVPTGENEAGFGGSWSNFPFFPSGVIVVTSGNEGLFIVKKATPPPIS